MELMQKQVEKQLGMKDLLTASDITSTQSTKAGVSTNQDNISKEEGIPKTKVNKDGFLEIFEPLEDDPKPA